MTINNTIKYATAGVFAAAGILASLIGCDEKPVSPTPLEKKLESVEKAESQEDMWAKYREDSKNRLMAECGMVLDSNEDYMGNIFTFGDYKTDRAGVESVQWLMRHELSKRGMKRVADLPKSERKGFVNSIGKRMDANGDMFVECKEGHAVIDPLSEALNKGE